MRLSAPLCEYSGICTHLCKAVRQIRQLVVCEVHLLQYGGTAQSRGQHAQPVERQVQDAEVLRNHA